MNPLTQTQNFFPENLVNTAFDMGAYKKRLSEMTEHHQETLPPANYRDFLEIEHADAAPQFYAKVVKSLEKISRLEIGQKLFRGLADLSQGRRIKIKMCNQDKYEEFSKARLEIDLSLKKFHAWPDINGNYILDISMTVTLIHELLHALHFFEDPEGIMENVKRGAFDKDGKLILLNSVISNLEEQVTITGISAIFDSISTCQDLGPISLCENTFRYARNLPLHFTHAGYISPKVIIQGDLKVDSETFSRYFERYWKRIPEDSFHKKTLFVEIDNPSENQSILLEKIRSLHLVNVCNSADLDGSSIQKLRTLECFDIQHIVGD